MATPSPGGRLAIATSDPRTGKGEIRVRDLRCDVATRLTFHAAADRSPVWSPDGTRIAFSSSRDGGGLYEKAAGGAGQAVASSYVKGELRLWDWARDGR